MTDLRDAARQALEALETVFMPHHPAVIALREALTEEALQRLTDANQEIEAVLEQPEQEPVACPHRDEPRGCYRVRCQLGRKCVEPLYTRPPRREGQELSNGEIYTAYITATNQTLRPQDERLALAFARAIEAALKERNT